MSYPSGNNPKSGLTDGAYPMQTTAYTSQGTPQQPSAQTYPPSVNCYPQPADGLKTPSAPQEPSNASRPQQESMPAVPGYSGTGFESVTVPPPAYEDIPEERPDREPFRSTISFTEEDAREAILDHANNKCCWGTGPARKMVIKDLTTSSAYHYTLETFGESRSTQWAFEPFSGGNVVVTGPIPGPWDIQAMPKELFLDAKVDVEVPNSACVQICFHCQGAAYFRCTSCSGSGRSRCAMCSGSGRRYVGGSSEPCYACTGGYKSCSPCNGSGKRSCEKCQGTAYLRWFIQLTIKWTNHRDSHVEQVSTLPAELFKDVRGEMAFDESYPRVYPVTNFPLPEINICSDKMVRDHATKFLNEKILMQRQRVQCVPVTNVDYTYKKTSSSFIVYGIEKKVHVLDYPATCCYGCSII